MDRAVELYMEELRKVQPLTEEEKNTLPRRLREDDHDAKKRIGELHLEMVVPIAQEYEGRGLWILDLIQEGNCGLVKALETFDWNNDAAEFPAFAEKWIRRAIEEAFKCACIDRRIPVEQIEKINNIMQARKKLQEELNREPTAQEIAWELGISDAEVEKFVPNTGESVDQEILELDMEETGDPEPNSMQEYLLEVLKDNCRITDREREVIYFRFGMDGNGPHSLEETAEAFGVTRERIRMIENKVMRRIHVRNRSKKIRDFYN